MQSSIERNEIFDLAVQFVNNTEKNVFLTGKAGSGKTTFLKYIKEHSHKKLAVVAPTGVAAINAGGVTIHSFFQLPLGNFVPTQGHIDDSFGSFYNKTNLLKHLRFSTEKRSLIQELELLIIDEVSMVKADVLDAIDAVLKYVRRTQHLPFGGVQMLFIGDLFQLPPVINTHEWKVLQKYYKSPFFFHASSLKDNPPFYIELKKIYRQNDASFIQLLNNVRNNEIHVEDLRLLNRRFQPDFNPQKEEYIILTSHNYKADQINQRELSALKAKLHTFQAEIKGEFKEKSTPAEQTLTIKEGAQIMFIKNDKGEIKRYYNGKIGIIKKIENEEISVKFPDENKELVVEKEIWKNIRYKYNKEEDVIEEEVIGTFTQFPIRLAWAITIHKSQGLTFNKAIIDAGDSFAAGQVYVALSRLTSLNGLVLFSKITEHCINTDNEAIAFTKTELQPPDLLNHLKHAQKLYLHSFILQVFNWNKLTEVFENFFNGIEERRIPFQEEARELTKVLLEKIKLQQKTAHRFNKQLLQMFPKAELDSYNHISSRIVAAEKYFNEALFIEVFTPLQAHYDRIKNLPKVKKYKKDIQDIIATVKQKKYKLDQVVKIINGLTQGMDPVSLLQENIRQKKESLAIQEKSEPELPKTKPPKGFSQKISLSLFKEGKSIVEIAKERSLATSTIEGHLALFIETGEINIKDLVPDNKIKIIQEVIEDIEEDISASQIKEILGETYSYGEIKAVLTHLKKIKAHVN